MRIARETPKDPLHLLGVKLWFLGFEHNLPITTRESLRLIWKQFMPLILLCNLIFYQCSYFTEVPWPQYQKMELGQKGQCKKSQIQSTIQFHCSKYQHSKPGILKEKFGMMLILHHFTQPINLVNQPKPLEPCFLLQFFTGTTKVML